jgi:hypothetical protein
VAAFCTLRAREITDGLVELLLHVVQRIGVRAERELLADFRRVAGKHGILCTLAEAALARPDEAVRAVIYPAVGGPASGYPDAARPGQGVPGDWPGLPHAIHTVMRASYQHHYRRLLPLLLAALNFRSNNAAHQPVIAALALLRKYASSKARTYGEEDVAPLEGIVRGGLQQFVLEAPAEGDRRVKRINDEIAALHALRDGLRSKEIGVVRADRYRDPDEDLPRDFDARRAYYYQAFNQPQEADQFVDRIQRELREALAALDAGLPANPTLTIGAAGQGRIKVTPLAGARRARNRPHPGQHPQPPQYR